MNGITCDRDGQLVSDLKKKFLTELGILTSDCDFYVTENGRIADESGEAQVGKVYRFCPRLLGGKGGFGSMLRAIGAQIEKTTNREACRDLSGRRMRDVNNEKKLQEWIEKAPERERKKKEEEEEKKKKKKNVEKKYFFDSKAYDEQKEKIQRDFEDAIKQGLKRPAKREEKKDIDPSKAKDWFGFDLDGSDDDDDEEDSENEVPMKKIKTEDTIQCQKESDQCQKEDTIQSQQEGTPQETEDRAVVSCPESG